jgi:hypothetical protein
VVQRRRAIRVLGVVALLAGLGVGAGVLAGGSTDSHRPVGTPEHVAAKVVAQRPLPSAAPPALVRWHGPVAGIFVHPLVLQPRRAFTDDTLGRGFQNYFVTAHEFRAMLDQLWRNGWTLVDVHRAARGEVRVPLGRKPLVLSEDDVNYYDYFDGRGLADRLVLDPQGAVRAEFHDRNGAHLTSDDVVPLVDAEVEKHPEFSADGAKGVLAVTGYQGLFGEHNLADAGTRERVKALVARLQVSGWTIASHTYGHIRLGNDSVATIMRDTTRWVAAARGLLGPTDVLIYPYGLEPTSAGIRALRDEGFRIQIGIDIRPRRVLRDGVVMIARMHIDGLAFDNPRRLAPLFDVATVRDPARPSR